jgi:hypothetical protein
VVPELFGTTPGGAAASKRPPGLKAMARGAEHSQIRKALEECGGKRRRKRRGAGRQPLDAVAQAQGLPRGALGHRFASLRRQRAEDPRGDVGPLNLKALFWREKTAAVAPVIATPLPFWVSVTLFNITARCRVPLERSPGSRDVARERGGGHRDLGVVEEAAAARTPTPPPLIALPRSRPRAVGGRHPVREVVQQRRV